MFSQIRNLLGAGQARNRVQAAVERTFSFQLTVYSIVVVWHVLHACSDTDVRQRRLPCPWYRTKTAPSYEDMLTRLRLALAEARFRPSPRPAPTSRKSDSAGHPHVSGRLSTNTRAAGASRDR